MASRAFSVATSNITSQLVLGANLNFDATQSTKISDPGANVLSIFTSSQERVRVDASGNVGIGTIPSYKLDVYGSMKTQGDFILSSSTGNKIYPYYFSSTNHNYIGSVSDGSIIFGTTGVGDPAERMRIDTSGSVIIGHTSAVGSARLSISDAATPKMNFLVGSTERAYISYDESSSIMTIDSDSIIRLRSNNAERFRIDNSGQISHYANQYNAYPGTSVQFEWVNRNGAGHDFYVNNAGTLAARIDNLGNFLIGTTNISISSGVGHKFVYGSTPYCGTVGASSLNSDSSYHLYSTGAGGYRFYVGYGGTIYAVSGSISTISDIRLKENVRDLDVGLNAIMALKPRVFDWKEGKGANIKNVRGFIAQEFETVFPDLIDEWKDPAPEGEEPYKTVRQDLIPVLVKAIQELTERVKTLENN